MAERAALKAPPAPARTPAPPARAEPAGQPATAWSELSTRSAPPAGVQCKLVVGAVDDPLEREADDVARRMSSDGNAGVLRRAPVRVQRMCSDCEESGHTCSHCASEEEEPAQRKPIDGLPILRVQGIAHARAPDQNAVDPAFETRLVGMRGGGQPLGRDVRSDLEPRIGHDLSSVRVHADGNAASAANTLRAKAFTTGRDIFFGAGQFAPTTRNGRQLLAHELAHVVQQTAPGPNTVQRQPDSTGNQDDASQDENSDYDWGEIQELLRGDTDPGGDAGGDESAQDEAPATGGGPSGGSGGTRNQPASSADEGEEVEVEIPEFDSGASEGACGDLVPPEPPLEEGDNEPVNPQEETFATAMLRMVGSSVMSFINPLAFAGGAAMTVWRQLPLSIRVRAVNAGMRQAEDIFATSARYTAPMPFNVWLVAGIRAFFARLRTMPERTRVAVFEKIGTVAFGQSLSFSLGYIRGLARGFFVDGLVGIVQMVLDFICLIPKVSGFIEALRRLFGGFTDQIENVVIALGLLELDLRNGARRALRELGMLINQPQRLMAMFGAVLAGGAQASARAGAMIADALMGAMRLSAHSMGRVVGRVVGVVAFEVLLFLVTSGGGAVVTAGKTIARVAFKVLARAGKMVLTAVRWLLDAIRFVRPLITSVSVTLTPAFRRVGFGLRRAFDAIGDFCRYILRVCRRGSLKCKIRLQSTQRRLARARRLAQTIGKNLRCRSRYVSRLGGFAPHDQYVKRVTGQSRDYFMWLGPRPRIGRRCSYDARMRGQRLLVEGKTGYGFLGKQGIQHRWWYRLVMAKLEEQRIRCFAIATACGYKYQFWMKSRHAANYLRSRWGGVPVVLHKP